MYIFYFLFSYIFSEIFIIGQPLGFLFELPVI